MENTISTTSENAYKKQCFFKDCCYQKLAIEILTSAINKNHIAPAYLFTGPKGVGQKEIALQFLEGISTLGQDQININYKSNLNNHPDFHIVEPSYLYQGKLIQNHMQLTKISKPIFHHKFV